MVHGALGCHLVLEPVSSQLLVTGCGQLVLPLCETLNACIKSWTLPLPSIWGFLSTAAHHKDEHRLLQRPDCPEDTLSERGLPRRNQHTVEEASTDSNRMPACTLVAQTPKSSCPRDRPSKNPDTSQVASHTCACTWARVRPEGLVHPETGASCSVEILKNTTYSCRKRNTSCTYHHWSSLLFYYTCSGNQQ